MAISDIKKNIYEIGTYNFKIYIIAYHLKVKHYCNSFEFNSSELKSSNKLIYLCNGKYSTLK